MWALLLYISLVIFCIITFWSIVKIATGLKTGAGRCIVYRQDGGIESALLLELNHQLAFRHQVRNRRGAIVRVCNCGNAFASPRLDADVDLLW